MNAITWICDPNTGHNFRARKRRQSIRLPFFPLAPVYPIPRIPALGYDRNNESSSLVKWQWKKTTVIAVWERHNPRTRLLITNRSSNASRAMSTSAVRGFSKNQPWRQFWPPKAEDFTKVQIQKAPWLAYKVDGSISNAKPWREWVLQNQSGVAKRGSTTHFEDW